jgi:hypothetical protein
MALAPEPDPICPVCHEGRLARRYDGWFVLPSAGYPRQNEQGAEVHQGVPVGITVCSQCEYVALFLPPTLDASGRPYRPGRRRRDLSRAEPGEAARGSAAVTREVNAALTLAARRAITGDDRALLEAVEAAYVSVGLELRWDYDKASGKMSIGTTEVER